MNTLHPELRSLLAAIPNEQLEIIEPETPPLLGLLRPADPAAAAATVTALRRGLLPWTVGPLPGDIVPTRPVVVVDLSRLSRVEPLQPRDGLVTVQAGARLNTLARLLRDEGWHAEPLSGGALLGEALVGRAGRVAAPGGYGPTLADRVVALAAVLPDGTLLRTPLAPRRATGPDLAGLLLGSRGALGMIVEATLRIDPLPETVHEAFWRFPSSRAAAAALARVPRIGLPLTAGVAEGELLALRLAGARSLVRATRELLDRLLNGGTQQPGPVPAGLLEPRLPTPRPPELGVVDLSARLRRALNPAGLLRTNDDPDF